MVSSSLIFLIVFLGVILLQVIAAILLTARRDHVSPLSREYWQW